MRRILTLPALAAAAAVLAGCAYPYYHPQPTYTPTTTVTPASFDKSWDAALGAAADAGILIVRADREGGRITGTKNGAAVTIDVQPQADKSLKVTFNAPASVQTRPTLGEQWHAAYERRMGR
jgi:hypothetical protein